MIGLNEPAKKYDEPSKKKIKHTDPNGPGSLGLIAMPKPVGSVETCSALQNQKLLIHPEKIPNCQKNFQDSILFEDYQHAISSKGGPTSKLSQVSDNKVLTEHINKLTISSQLSKDHSSKAFQQIKKVSAPQHQLLRPKEVRNLTEIDGDYLSIEQYDERSGWDRRNKAAFADEVFPDLQTNPTPLKKRVRYLDNGNTSQHIEESCTPTSILDSTSKPLDCGLHFSIPESFTPLPQLNQPTKAKRAKISQTEVNESARLRTSISIKTLSRDPPQAGSHVHLTFTHSKGIRIDVQEDIFDDSSLGPMRQPRRRTPGDANSDDLNSASVEGMH